MSFNAFSTARLLLREFSTEGLDGRAMDVLLCDPECQRYLSTGGMRWPSGEEWVTNAAVQQRRGSSRRQFDLAICLLSDLDTPVGSVSIEVQDVEAKEASIVFMLARSQWGKGLASEAVSAAVAFAVEHLAERVSLLRATVVPDNIGSVRVLEKSHFAHVSDSSYELNGETRRQHCFEYRTATPTEAAEQPAKSRSGPGVEYSMWPAPLLQRLNAFRDRYLGDASVLDKAALAPAVAAKLAERGATERGVAELYLLHQAAL